MKHYVSSHDWCYNKLLWTLVFHHAWQVCACSVLPAIQLWCHGSVVWVVVSVCLSVSLIGWEAMCLCNNLSGISPCLASLCLLERGWLAVGHPFLSPRRALIDTQLDFSLRLSVTKPILALWTIISYFFQLITTFWDYWKILQLVWKNFAHFLQFLAN